MKIASCGGKVKEGAGRNRYREDASRKPGSRYRADVHGQAADATRAGAVKLDRWIRNAIETPP
jgi:hypothetical protein